ncbi:MAG: hypothetical protein GY796_31155 [Chloroflexi bacterium]|nr:hypothetical protein [Chloroflexota bacterium]
MKRIFLFLILTVLISGLYVAQQTVHAQSSNVDEAAPQHILAATVQIKLKAPLYDEAGNRLIGESNGEWRELNDVANGLGTLVLVDGELLIVTHDHWGEMLLKAEWVEFKDANGKLLAEISGLFFRNLLRYRDRGTLLLAAPQELASYAGQAVVMEHGLSPTASNEVFLTRHLPGSARVEIVTARVTAVSHETGIPAYELQSVDGQSVVKGDSGGGIWYQGQLVGNMWWTVVAETVSVTAGVETITQKQVTDSSVAAVYSDAVQQSLVKAESDMLSLGND